MRNKIYGHTDILKTLIFTTLLGHEIIIFIITIFSYYQFYFQLNMLLSVQIYMYSNFTAS